MTDIEVPADTTVRPSPPVRPQVRIVLTVVFLVFLGNTALNPILAPLSREVGLAEWQVGLTISAAAVMIVTTSQLWGRRSQSWGRRPVLVAALGLAVGSMTLFAVLVHLGMRGLVTGTALFVLFVLLRGVVFGTAVAAVVPTAQAYIADITTGEAERVKGMAGVGATQGMAMIGGAVLSGSLAGLGLMAPLVVIPVLLAAALALVLLRLHREPRAELVEHPVRVRPTDSRVWPYLLAGFGMFTALGFIMILTGFLVQDRFGLGPERTGMVTGAALLAAGLGMVLAQSVVVPRSRWSPPTLLRIGSLTATAGFGVLVPDLGPAGLLTSMALIGLGLGIAMPGYVAGPSLLMRREELGGMAGLVQANNGLTFVTAPLLGTVLYASWPALPVIVGGTIMGLVAVFVWVHPRFRPASHVTPAGRS